MTTNTQKVPSALTVGDYSIPRNKIPETSQYTLMYRTLSHILNNESAAYKGRIAAEKAEDGTPKYDATEIAVMVHDWKEKKIQQILDGELGVRVVGPRMTSDEKIRYEFTKNAIIGQLAKKGKVAPKASDTEAWDNLVERALKVPELAAAADEEVARRKAAAMVPDFEIPDDVEGDESEGDESDDDEGADGDESDQDESEQ